MPEVQISTEFRSERLTAVFQQLFSEEYATILEAGGEEPLYLPAKNSVQARIVFRKDFFASALHEVAHWCIAGDKRRRLQDYGYWYAPDGRTEEQQALFESVEIKPQALEWIFSVACGYKFYVSTDNLNGEHGASLAFKIKIHAQAGIYRKTMPSRALRFVNGLAEEFNKADVLCGENFMLKHIV